MKYFVQDLFYHFKNAKGFINKFFYLMVIVSPLTVILSLVLFVLKIIYGAAVTVPAVLAFGLFPFVLIMTIVAVVLVRKMMGR